MPLSLRWLVTQEDLTNADRYWNAHFIKVEIQVPQR